MSLLTQLAAYGVGWWLVFIFTAFLAGRSHRVWAILLGHVLIAAVICTLDVRWIQAGMRRVGWDGQPDQDVIFIIGVLIRIVLVNILLLPVNALGWLLSRRVRVVATSAVSLR